MESHIRLVHEDAWKPDSLYVKRPLEWFLGRKVKMAFSTLDNNAEHMWVAVERIDGVNLIGTLANDPIAATQLQFGDEVSFSRCQVEAVDLSVEEWWGEIELLRGQGDYLNRWLGVPSRDSGFGQFFNESFTPRLALNRWVRWQPSDHESLTFLSEIAARREEQRDEA